MKIINGVRIMNKFNILAFTICLFLTGNVYSAQYEVKMLSSGSGGSMVFEPSVIKRTTIYNRCSSFGVYRF